MHKGLNSVLSRADRLCNQDTGSGYDEGKKQHELEKCVGPSAADFKAVLHLIIETACTAQVVYCAVVLFYLMACAELTCMHE